MLIKQMVEILPQRAHISNHHNAHFKYLNILFVNYTSIKLKKKKSVLFPALVSRTLLLGTTRITTPRVIRLYSMLGPFRGSQYVS